jgi:hypothetical protein
MSPTNDDHHFQQIRIHGLSPSGVAPTISELVRKAQLASSLDHHFQQIRIHGLSPSGIAPTISELVRKAQLASSLAASQMIVPHSHADQGSNATVHPDTAGNNAENEGFAEQSTAASLASLIFASPTPKEATNVDGFTTPPLFKYNTPCSDSTTSSNRSSSYESCNHLPNDPRTPRQRRLDTPPPPDPSKLAAQKASGTFHWSGTMYPDILRCTEIVKVLTLDPAADPLQIHKSICHFYKFPKAMFKDDDTIVFPTKSLEAAMILLAYCYKNGSISPEHMEAQSLALTMDLWMLACKLDMLSLSFDAAEGIRKKLKTADIPQLCEFTRVRVSLESDEWKEYIDFLPTAVDVWMEDGEYR